MILRKRGGREGSAVGYLLEELGDKRFQQLCQALLLPEFPGLVCLPVGQADGGRDGLTRPQNGPFRVFQMKFTKHPERVKNPATELAALVRGERDNILALVREGLDEYLLVTNISTTSAKASGSYDKLEAKLDELSVEYGVPMRCLWRDDLERRLDRSPSSLRFSYGEMLVGWDAIRYLLDQERDSERMERLGDIVRRVAAAQWHEDENVKFNQVELDSHALADLFVEIDAVSTPASRANGRLSLERRSHPAASALLNPTSLLTTVRGAPGQGKSTLVQFVCQSHRAYFLKYAEVLADLPEGLAPAKPRVPVRVDLRDYGSWLNGYDPFGLDATGEMPKRRRSRGSDSLESFLAALMSSASGGAEVDMSVLSDLTRRFPFIVALDGLDEVADPGTRALVVEQIEVAARRMSTADVKHQVVVTTRPNFADLAEPSPEHFEYLDLLPLRPRSRTQYLHKWARVQGLQGREKTSLERIFAKRSADEHVSSLAQNPMQLTILLYLIKQRGESIPSKRTELYRSYMTLFLDREAAKDEKVAEFRSLLEEVTAYLGWHLQSQAEAAGGDGRASVAEIRRSLFEYLDGIEADISLVDVLYTKVTTRVWALTSRVQGTFEFDVQPIREYFAAKYLAEGVAGQPNLTKADILRELALRPYWFNTARFLAGFCTPAELGGLVMVLQDEADRLPYSIRRRSFIWTLLSDGVFVSRPKEQGRAVALLRDDLSIRVMYERLCNHDLPSLTPERGGAQLEQWVLEDVEKDPLSGLSRERVGVQRVLDPRDGPFDDWWHERAAKAQSSQEVAAWLQLGSARLAPTRRPLTDSAATEAMSGSQVEAALEAGYAPPVDSRTEERFVRAVLDGHCFEVLPTAQSYPADLLHLLAPQRLLRRALGRDKSDKLYLSVAGLSELEHTRPPSVVDRARSRQPAVDAIAAAARTGRGQKGTTSIFGNTATAISAAYGRCWAASEIAIIGAAAQNLQTGGDLTPGANPLGHDGDYGVLIRDVRSNRGRWEWWDGLSHEIEGDYLDAASWALALVTCANEEVIGKCLGRLETLVSSLPDDELRALLLSSARLGAARIRTVARGFELVAACQERHWALGLMLAHQVAGVQTGGLLKDFSVPALESMAAVGIAGWPAWHEAWSLVRRDDTRMLSVLKAAGPFAARNGVVPAAGIKSDIAIEILNDVGAYPLEWVLAACQRLTPDRASDSLAATASGQGWFLTD